MADYIRETTTQSSPLTGNKKIQRDTAMNGSTIGGQE